MSESLIETVKLWLDHDPDPETRQELERLLQNKDLPELADRFRGRLQFGTAGLRGIIGAGPMRFNRAVVIQTTDALARYLLQQAKTSQKRGVVIGYDARRHSKTFAEESARVLGGHGIKTYLFATLVPTPLLAYAVLKLKTIAGIMITASHNAREYNGYKVYWKNGAQLLSPHDTGIAEKIGSAPFADQIPRPTLEKLENEENLLFRLDDSVADAYIDEILKQRIYPHISRHSVKVLYTPLHGVGYSLFKRIIQQAGYTGVQAVASQAHPDGEFPTLTIPNPEDKSALAAALNQAASTGAELILANDPDADRLAACTRDRDGSFQILSGDEIGILLADYLLTGLKERSRLPPRPVVVTTVVSSMLLRKLAEAHHVRCEETLTGFKWINNRAMELESRGYQFLFGYEEAIGYCIGPVVRDKDGLSAALLFLEMTAWHNSRGETLLDHLLAIYQRFDLFHKYQASREFTDSSGQQAMWEILDHLRNMPPKDIAGQPVDLICDYLRQQQRQAVSGSITALPQPKTNMIAFILAAGDRILVRPSGTESKIKFYFETIIPRKDFTDLRHGRALAKEKTENLVKGIEKITNLSL